MVDTALERLGRLDFLLNCAGNSHVGPVVEMSYAAWRSVLDVHLTGTFLCCRAAIDPLLASRGRIVSISSTYAYKGRPNGAHYSAAKAGIVGLTKVLAGELAPHVNVNALAPGPIDTSRWRGNLAEADYQARKARRIEDIPLGRMGEPEDVAEAALFLLSPASSWITGSVLHVTGGELMV
jgi:3-oxoacyl-[acyl-carrier protein] reductase